MKFCRHVRPNQASKGCELGEETTRGGREVGSMCVCVCLAHEGGKSTEPKAVEQLSS